MSLELTHAQIEELLGAFAVDAVEADEAEAIELHLRECPRCRAEVSEHREVAVLLTYTGSPAPDGVWDRILVELEPAPPALRMPALPQPPLPPTAPSGSPAATVSDLAARRATVRTRTLVAVVTAAAVIVSVLGVIAVNQSHRLDRLDASLRDMSVDRVAARAMSDARATTGRLTSTDGRISAPVVVNTRGMGYLLAAKLPVLPPGRTYQLWGRVGRSVLSLGAFDGGADVVQFQVGNWKRQHLRQLLVTDEKAPGVLATKQQPLLSGPI